MRNRLIRILLLILFTGILFQIAKEEPVKTGATVSDYENTKYVYTTQLENSTEKVVVDFPFMLLKAPKYYDDLAMTDETKNGEKRPEYTESREADGSASEHVQENEYFDFAIANVSDYVNVRKEPNTDCDIIGKIYNGAIAQILEITGPAQDWFRIISGNVEGYIKSEYFLFGDAAVAVIDDFITRYAYVLADRLNVRERPNLESGRIGYVNQGEKLKVIEIDGDWTKVQYTESKTGYVASEYISVKEEYIYARTLEEDAEEQAENRKREERENSNERTFAENKTISVTAPSGNYESNSEMRTAIVDYAMQFLGNRYVHGGNSLVTGTDCSGFTSLIYAEFGYSISRTPAGQLSDAGRSIDYSEIQPGDIICYGSGKCTHVALYIGDGQIIHEANSRKGVVIYDADYDNILGVKNILD